MDSKKNAFSSYLKYVEQELIDAYVSRGGATCRFVEGDHAERRGVLTQSIRQLALWKGLVVTEVELSNDLPLNDWKQITQYVLKNMEANINGILVRSFPAIVAKIAEVGEVELEMLLQKDHSLPHAGFRNAIWWLCQKEQQGLAQDEALQSFLLGEKVSVAELNSFGLNGVKGSLTQKNAELILQTVFSALTMLNASGSLLLLTEQEDHFVYNKQSTALEKLRISANVIRRLIDGCTTGVLNGTLVFTVSRKGFLERCADVYPAVGQRLQIVKNGLRRAAWRFPIASLDQLTNEKVESWEPYFGLNGDMSVLKSLESLRFGLVPHRHVERLTIGYAEIERWAEQCRSDLNLPGIHLITGPFGTGKSHVIEVLRHTASKRGSVFTRVELDGRSVSMSEPNLLFRAICRNLQFPDGANESPVISLYEKAIERGHNVLSFPSSGMYKIKDYFETIQLLQRFGKLDNFAFQLESVFSGGEEFPIRSLIHDIAVETGLRQSQFQIESLIDRSLDKRTHSFLEALAGLAILCRLSGYDGLVVAFDEFEVETHGDKKQFERVLALLREILTYVEQSGLIPPSPVTLIFSAVGKATAGDAFLERLTALAGGSVYRLSQWTDHQTIELASRIFELYADSYDLCESFDSTLARSVNQLLQNNGMAGNTLIRSFVKWYLALLDMKYGPPVLLNTKERRA
ncbi:hypothetical protein ASG89_11485 [Paenibacillus sp. Soil766]|uniref:BREX system ATP-binding domain-containing protein n=1 Tax=Paenibacillus sp. Soil766 TaxID=1736404 RepID=UPI000710E3C1|nr:BREX system ATP-binding domain-containing protein [Paenibacillus sp. Soil766]KRE83741.1 hypothetical protein ASG89_11485 [Paenibacillus sp. Soil766]